MGNALYDRRCRLTIANPVATPNDFKDTLTDVIEIDGGTTDNRAITGMRIQFKITKSLKKEPNTSEIVVTNLNEKSRSNLQRKGVRVLLEAGYKETGVKRIFSGDVRTVDHIRNGADWDSTFRLGDGGRSWQYARVAESFGPGAKVADVIRASAKSLGIDLGNLDDVIGDVSSTFDHGYALCGSASREFDRLISALGKQEWSWSVQDNKLQVLKGDATTILLPEISANTGLIGSPEMGSPAKKGAPALVTFKSLLIPLTPGARVKLVSERYNGLLKIQSCEYTGDTHGQPWYVNCAASILK